MYNKVKKNGLEVVSMIGQTNLFDDVIKSDERFVIVVQSLEEKMVNSLKIL